MEVPSIWHLPLIGYFGLIASLLWLIRPKIGHPTLSTSSLLMLSTSIVATYFTWKYMLEYMAWSKKEAAIRAGVKVVTSREWLAETSLFQEAWLQVCKTTTAWWWSEQLCAWTVGPLTILMAIEGAVPRFHSSYASLIRFIAGRRHQVKHIWAYMLLGQIVAISTAQSLFLAVLVSVPNAASRPEAHASWTLIAVVLAALFNVALSPRLVHEPAAFLANLLIMHAVIFVPLSSVKSKSSGLSLSRLYLYVAIICARLRLPTYTQLLPGFSSSPVASLVALARQEYSTFYEHPAQTSISYDVVLASLSFVAWMLLENRRMGAHKVGWIWVAALTAIMPVVGIAVSGGLYLSARENELEKDDELRARSRPGKEKST